MIRLIIVALIGVASVAASDSVRIKDLLKKTSTNAMPSYQVVGEIVGAQEGSSPFSYTMSVDSVADQGLNVVIISSMTESMLTLNTNFDVMESTFNVKNAALAEKTKYDSRIAVRNDQDEVIFNFKQDGVVVKTKGAYYTDNTIDSFSIIPVLQAVAGEDVSYIKANFVIEHLAMAAPTLIEKKIKDNLRDELQAYTVPDLIKGRLRDYKGEYIVYTLKVVGWKGLVYKHQHYYVFSSQAPYHYIAHWGGPNEMNLFSWVRISSNGDV